MPDGITLSGDDPEKTRWQELAVMRDGNTSHWHLQIDPETQRANAEHLAHCWNCHEELLEALQRLVKRQLEANTDYQAITVAQAAIHHATQEQ